MRTVNMILHYAESAKREVLHDLENAGLIGNAQIRYASLHAIVVTIVHLMTADGYAPAQIQKATTELETGWALD